MAKDNAITMPATESPQQAKMDALVGYLLMIGVALSMTLIVAGMLWQFFRTGRFLVERPLAGMNLFEFVVDEVRLVVHGEFHPRNLVDAGIVVLMFTPYLRVVASMFYFIFALKNWKYSLFTAVVLGILTFSLFLR